jgi:hypothetical protein
MSFSLIFKILAGRKMHSGDEKQTVLPDVVAVSVTPCRPPTIPKLSCKDVWETFKTDVKNDRDVK